MNQHIKRAGTTNNKPEWFLINMAHAKLAISNFNFACSFCHLSEKCWMRSIRKPTLATSNIALAFQEHRLLSSKCVISPFDIIHICTYDG